MSDLFLPGNQGAEHDESVLARLDEAWTQLQAQNDPDPDPGDAPTAVVDDPEVAEGASITPEAETEEGGREPGPTSPAPDSPSSDLDDAPPLPTLPEQQFVIGETSGAGDDTPPEPAPSSEQPQGGLDLNEYAERLFGRDLGVQEMLSLLEYGTATATAPPEVQQAIDYMLRTGQLPPSVMPTAPVDAPPIPRATPPLDLDDDDEVDPHVAALNARLAQIEAREAEIERERMAQQQAWIEAERIEGLREWREEHPSLTETDLGVLLSRSQQGNHFQTAFQFTNFQNPRHAMRQAMDLSLLNDPVLSQREVEARVAAETERRRADEERIRKASAVTGGQRAANTPAPPAPQKGAKPWQVEAAAELRNMVQGT